MPIYKIIDAYNILNLGIIILKKIAIKLRAQRLINRGALYEQPRFFYYLDLVELMLKPPIIKTTTYHAGKEQEAAANRYNTTPDYPYAFCEASYCLMELCRTWVLFLVTI